MVVVAVLGEWRAMRRGLGERGCFGGGCVVYQSAPVEKAALAAGRARPRRVIHEGGPISTRVVDN